MRSAYLCQLTVLSANWKYNERGLNVCTFVDYELCVSFSPFLLGFSKDLETV